MAFDLQWDGLLTVDEAAQRAKVHPHTVRRWMQKGKVEYVRLPDGYPRIVAASLTTRKKQPDWLEGVVACPASVQRFCDFYVHDDSGEIARRHQVDVEIVREILMRFLAFL